MKFKAIVPAAGGGTRLRPHTHVVPKVLLEVAGKPIIGHIIDRVLPAGPEEICVVIGAQGELVESYLARNYDCRFRFITQSEPLGLGHAVSQAASCFAGEAALVLLGDTIVDLDMRAMVGSENLIGVREVSDPRRFGVVEMEGDTVRRVVEKPEVPPSNLALVGLYFLVDSRPLFEALGELIEQDLRTRDEYQLTDALQIMLDRGTTIKTRTIEHWLDCGTPAALLATNRYLLRINGHFRPRQGSVLVPPVFVHDEAVVESSIIGPNASVGDGVEIHNSIVRDSIVNPGAVLDHVLLEDSIVGERSVVRDNPRKLNLGSFSQLEMG